MASYAVNTVVVGAGAEAHAAQGGYASETLFPLLGVQPLVGRFFNEDENRPDQRRARGRARLRRLAALVRRQPRRDRSRPHDRQRAVFDHRRRAARLHRSAVRPGRRLAADQPSRPGDSEGLADVLECAVARDRRPAETWRHVRAGCRGADGDPSARLHRHRAVRREGPNDGGADLGQRRRRRGAGSHGRALAVRRRAHRAADRLRERREPASRAWIAPVARGRAACGARRGPIASGAPAARRIDAARLRRRGRRIDRRVRAGRARAHGRSSRGWTGRPRR